MAVRDDITVDWIASPRIVTLAAPTTFIGMLDLYQTLRFLERQPIEMERPSIVDGFGQFYLDPQQNYGRIVQLQNAVFRFEDRSGPDWVQCFVEANLTAVDASGDPMEPIMNSAFVNVVRTLDGSAVLLQNSILDTIPAIKTDTEDILAGTGSVLADTTSILADTGTLKTGQTSIQSSLTTAYGVLLSLREGNVRRTLYLATKQDNTRKVAVGAIDREVIDVKADSAPDWSAPVSTKTRYFWYRNLGDTEAYKIGASA